MRRTCVVLLLTLTVAVPAYADVTIKSTITGTGMGMSGKMPSTTYLKGSKMRSDTQRDGKTQTLIFDLDSQKMYIFESGRKEAEVFDMATMNAEIGKSVDMSDIKTSVKPNGQTKQFGALTANGYDMEVSVAASMGGNKDMEMTVTMTGPVWIVKDAPGSDDYLRFYKAASEKGWIFSDPRSAKAQPGPAKAMAEMYRQFAEIGGIMYESQMQMKMGMGGAAAGPMAGILAKLGNMSMHQVVESVETAPLADDLFTVPAGYKLNQRK